MNAKQLSVFLAGVFALSSLPALAAEAGTQATEASVPAKHKPVPHKKETMKKEGKEERSENKMEERKETRSQEKKEEMKK